MRSTQVILRIIAWQIMSLQMGKAATQLTEGSSVVIHNMISKTKMSVARRIRHRSRQLDILGFGCHRQ